MKKALVMLSAIGALFSLSAPPATAAEGLELFSAGVNTGRLGFTTAVWGTTDRLTDRTYHQITHYCNFSINGVGNDVVITIMANAQAGPHATPVSTGIYCDVRDEDGNIAHWDARALPGASVSMVSPSVVLSNNGPYTVCSQGSGQWDDTHLYQTPLRCQEPNLPVTPVSSLPLPI